MKLAPSNDVSRSAAAGLRRQNRRIRDKVFGDLGAHVLDLPGFMDAPHHVDEKYYRAMPPGSLAERLTVAARDRIYDDFIRYCAPRPDDRILDVGACDVVNDAANLLERKYPYPARITALGLGDGADFRAAFPDVTYRRIAPCRRLPFADKSFAVAASNAVLEHVGSAANQAGFVAELMRVADRIFITVPHRYFPVEHHTAIPMLHYWNASFRTACRLLGKSEWGDERNLILMSRRRLRAPAPAGAVIVSTGLRLGPMSSNLLLFARGAKSEPPAPVPEPLSVGSHRAELIQGAT